LSIDSNNKDNG